MKLKGILLTAASCVLTAAIAVGGTLAYLQSDDSDVNVMTTGSVKIAQHEYERVVDANGNYTTIDVDGNTSYELKEFTQAKPLLPATALDANGNPYNHGAGNYGDTYVYMSQVGSQGSVKMFTTKNVQDKIITVENTGKSDAFVRTWIAIEDPFTENRIGVNVGGPGYYKQTPWTSVEIDGTTYSVTCFTYDEALNPGEESYPSLLQVYLNYKATNDDMKLLGDTFDILAFSQAVQADGFADAKTALEAAFGTEHPWVGTVDVPVVVSDADDLVEALESGESVLFTEDIKINPANMSNAYGTTGINVKNGQTINGNGKTLDIKGAGGTWDSGISTTGGVINDLTVTGSFRGIFINHNSTEKSKVVLNNVIIDGTTYTISCDQGSNSGFEANNSTFKGWTSYAKTLGNATFNDCYFGAGNGYSFCRPYAPTAFVGCEFEAGYRIDARAAVTFENCTIGGQPLTAANLDTLVIGGISNATVIK
ncbi:MAG: hypothetical protein IJ370_07735 [Oscillospiraceae bacterium]|nr:hypothetical protein [Oscillospiraceae bacterium]